MAWWTTATSVAALGAWWPTWMALEAITRVTIGKDRALTISPILSGIMAGLIFGALIGLAQLVILTQWLQRMEWWIVATAVGEAVYLSFVFSRWQTASLGADSDDLSILAERGAIHGLALGVAQSLVLRSRVKRSTLWILATLSGSVLGELLFRGYEKEGGYLFLLLGPFPTYGILGIVSGIALAVLLRRSYRKASKQYTEQT